MGSRSPDDFENPEEALKYIYDEHISPATEAFLEIAPLLNLKIISPEVSSEETAFLLFCRGLIFSEVANGTRDGHPMRLHIGLIDDATCNAWAFTTADADFIGINTGLRLAIINIARALVSQGNLFPDVGNPGVVSPVKITANGANFANTILGIQVEPLADHDRELLARYLSHATIAYIVHHELAHIYQGHTSWINSHGGFAVISEYKVPDRGNFSGITRQTLERSADIQAIQSALRCQLKPKELFLDGIAKWELEPRPGQLPVEYTAALVCLGSQIINILYADTEITNERLFDGDHPHPVVRTGINLKAGVDILCHRTNANRQDAAAIMIAAFETGLEAWRAAFPGTGFFNTGIMNDAAVELLVNDINEAYDAEWARILPELDKLKRGGTLPGVSYKPNPWFNTPS